jgi:ElaA protein
MPQINWTTKHFKDLSVDEYFEILFLRSEIFIIEQNCPYMDVDEKDRKAFHLFGRNEAGKVIAVTRILPKGVSYAEMSIGRVALKKEYRRTGIGDELMQESIKYIEQQFGKQNIRISAQQYLLNFYQKQGFKQVSEMYLEDNQPHMEMLRGKL